MIDRPESPDDHAGIGRLHGDAFPTPAEASLVERLRAEGDVVVSLVTIEAGEVVGHVLLSRMRASFRALGLGPVAVAAGWRRRGLAAGLIEAAIAQARAQGWEAIFVLGDPAYYRRFGFAVAAAQPFDSPYAGPYFMALVLAEAGLPVRSGRVDYAPAFAAVG
jgi:putative acetyltransferase